jgi:hypothetical protein
MLTGDLWHDEDLVFAQPNGRPIDTKAAHIDRAVRTTSALGNRRCADVGTTPIVPTS